MVPSSSLQLVNSSSWEVPLSFNKQGGLLNKYQWKELKHRLLTDFPIDYLVCLQMALLTFTLTMMQVQCILLQIFRKYCIPMIDHE